MKLALALALLVSSVDGGADAPLRAVGVAHGLLVLDDGRTVTVDGGVWLADEVARDRARDQARLAAENRELKSHPVEVPVVPIAVVLVTVALAAFVGGYFTPHP